MAFGQLGAAHHARARFYEDLSQMLDAGLGMRQALEMLASGGGPRAPAARALADRVLAGAPLAEAMAASPAAFSAFERHATEAGERSGRLPDSLRALADYFEVRGAALDKLIVIAYPIALLHLAILVRAIVVSQLASGFAYARAAALPIAALWGAAFLAFSVARTLRASEAGRRRVDAVALAAPGVGGLARTASLAEYAQALGLLYEAGIPIVEALERAAEATRNSVFADAGRRVAARVRGGLKIADALAEEPAAFPRPFTEAVRIGEATGKLDAQLGRAARAAREESDRAIRRASVALPAAVYAAVVCYLAYFVISFYVGYYGRILSGDF
jgi:type IV pilus assembly protein PilC